MLAKHKLFLTLPLLAIALNSCGASEWKKIDLDTFKEEVKAVTKVVDSSKLESLTVNGIITINRAPMDNEVLEYDDFKVETSSFNSDDRKSYIIGFYINLLFAPVFADGNNTLIGFEKPYYYYSGNNGWKAESMYKDEEFTLTWDKNGYITSVDDGDLNEINFKVTYKFAE